MGSSLLYTSIAYYMQNGGGWVQIACKNAYVLNGRPLICNELFIAQMHDWFTVMVGGIRVVSRI